MKRERNLSDLFHCESIFEERTSALYRNLSERVELPEIKSRILRIAEDSQKHSRILQEIAKSIGKSGMKERDCERNYGRSWRILNTVSEEILKKGRISVEELKFLAEELSFLESISGEEYTMMVQLTSVQSMEEKIRTVYGFDVKNLKGKLSEIVEDEETHSQLLAEIREIIVERMKPKAKHPAVEYRNPDAWSNPPSPSTG